METDMYYRVGYGLSSKLLDYKNGIVFIRLPWDESGRRLIMQRRTNWHIAGKRLIRSLIGRLLVKFSLLTRRRITIKRT